MADQLLDAKGLNCPLPILRAKKTLKDVAMGGTLEVLATDPGAVKDFEAFCRATGNELKASKVDGKVFIGCRHGERSPSASFPRPKSSNRAVVYKEHAKPGFSAA